MPDTATRPLHRPRVVIVGSGFGGLTAARTLGKADVDLTVIDRTNHHLFQPLLYQVAMASLSPSDISAPIRWVLRRNRNTTVLLGDVREIDVAARQVHIDGTREPVPYDYLIVAAGTQPSYYTHPEWEPFAPGLKTIADATEIRRRFLSAFEEAEKTNDPDERQAWMTFVIVGGGPTGCELAGVLQDIARKALRPDFRRIDTRDTYVILLEAGPRILPEFPTSLAEHARADLKSLHVDVRTDSAVTHVDGHVVRTAHDVIPTRTVFWAAGNVASPVGKALGAPLDRHGRVLVERDLSVPDHPEIFVIGDLAAAMSDNGKLAPGMAQAAIQEGRAAARNVLHSIRAQPRDAFHYVDKGELATIGRNKAIGNLLGGRVQVTGLLAWWLWLVIHIAYLIGFRNRVSVLLQWGYAYLTYQRGSRLIVDYGHRFGPATDFRPPAEPSGAQPATSAPRH